VGYRSGSATGLTSRQPTAIQIKDSSGIVSGITTNYIGDELKLPKEVGQVNA